MEEFAIDLNNTAAVQLERLSARERLAAYVELTKPRITFLIVLTSAAGFVLASGARVDYAALGRAMFGIALLSSGIATLNQFMERDLDALREHRLLPQFRHDQPVESEAAFVDEAVVFHPGRG